MPVCLKCGTDIVTPGGETAPCPNCGTPPNAPATPALAPAPTAPAPAPLTRPPATRPGGAFRRVLLGGLGLLVLVILLAESGAVAAESTDTKWKAEGKYEFESSSGGPRGMRPTPLRGVSFTPTVTVSVPRGAGYDLATEAATALKKAGTGGGGSGRSKLEITITRVTPEGATWVPFHKSGSCTFVATYTLTAETPGSSFAARGEVSGDVTQTMTGLCSSGLFREKMGQAIAAAIASDISKLVAKHSRACRGRRTVGNNSG